MKFRSWLVEGFIDEYNSGIERVLSDGFGVVMGVIFRERSEFIEEGELGDVCFEHRRMEEWDLRTGVGNLWTGEELFNMKCWSWLVEGFIGEYDSGIERVLSDGFGVLIDGKSSEMGEFIEECEVADVCFEHRRMEEWDLRTGVWNLWTGEELFNMKCWSWLGEGFIGEYDSGIERVLSDGFGVPIGVIFREMSEFIEEGVLGDVCFEHRRMEEWDLRTGVVIFNGKLLAWLWEGLLRIFIKGEVVGVSGRWDAVISEFMEEGVLRELWIGIGGEVVGISGSWVVLDGSSSSSEKLSKPTILVNMMSSASVNHIFIMISYQNFFNLLQHSTKESLHIRWWNTHFHRLGWNSPKMLSLDLKSSQKIFGSSPPPQPQ